MITIGQYEHEKVAQEIAEFLRDRGHEVYNIKIVAGAIEVGISNFGDDTVLKVIRKARLVKGLRRDMTIKLVI